MVRSNLTIYSYNICNQIDRSLLMLGLGFEAKTVL